MAHKKTSHKPGTYQQQPPEQEDDVDMALARSIYVSGINLGLNICENNLPFMVGDIDLLTERAIEAYKAQKRKGSE